MVPTSMSKSSEPENMSITLRGPGIFSYGEGAGEEVVSLEGPGGPDVTISVLTRGKRKVRVRAQEAGKVRASVLPGASRRNQRG